MLELNPPKNKIQFSVSQEVGEGEGVYNGQIYHLQI